MTNLLLVDDEQGWLYSLRLSIMQAEIAGPDNIFLASSGAEALTVVKKEKINLILLDLMMGKESGMDVMKEIRRSGSDTPIVIMTGVNSIHSAMNCINQGAADYLVKTLDVDELNAGIKRILAETDRKEADSVKSSESSVPHEFGKFITKDPEIIGIFKYLKSIAGSNMPVLITGESGTGKGVLAECASALFRPAKPFVSVNVSGLDTQVFSDTLFGHLRGAFTGADSIRSGMIMQAEKGVIFLDEIGDLEMQSQLKLLYLAQDGRYQALGSDLLISSEARLICATNQDLKLKAESGEFRKDLYYRLVAHHVHLPPLRVRKKDIPLLAKSFVEAAARDYEKPDLHINDNVVQLLATYDFPGNVRQLRTMIYDAAARTKNSEITLFDLRHLFADMESVNNNGSINMSNLPKLRDIVDDLIDNAMKLSGGNQTKAAGMIGISQSALSRRLKKENK